MRAIIVIARASVLPVYLIGLIAALVVFGHMLEAIGVLIVVLAFIAVLLWIRHMDLRDRRESDRPTFTRDEIAPLLDTTSDRGLTKAQTAPSMSLPLKRSWER